MEENEGYQKFVNFSRYCGSCKYADVKETDDPCNECLAIPARADGSRKPINFKERD